MAEAEAEEKRSRRTSSSSKEKINLESVEDNKYVTSHVAVSVSNLHGSHHFHHDTVSITCMAAASH